MNRRSFMASLAALLYRPKLGFHANFVLLTTPGQVDVGTWNQACDMLTAIFEAIGIEIWDRRFAYEHPCPELNEYEKEAEMLAYLEAWAKLIPLPRAHETHFFVPKAKIPFGTVTYGLSQLHRPEPRFSFSSTDPSPYVTAITAAHEIGHNLNAVHENQTPNVMNQAVVAEAWQGEELTFRQPDIRIMRQYITHSLPRAKNHPSSFP